VVAPVIDVLPLRIGVLGGTFDPVHIGHLRGGLEVAELMQLDELRLTPNARPPHRDTPQVSALDRLAMVECAVAGVATLVVDSRELQRDTPSYTIDTLELMRADLAADDQLFYCWAGTLFAACPHGIAGRIYSCIAISWCYSARMPTANRRMPCATCWQRAR
jgi:cytidyltransferase-related domain